MVPGNTWLLKCHNTMWEGIAIQERITLVFHTLAIWTPLTASSWSHALWSHMTWVQIPAPLLPEWCWATYLLKPQSLRFFHYKTEIRNNTYMDKWDVLYIYNLFYYSAIKRKDIMTHATIWMNPEDIMLCEISQSQKDKYCRIPLLQRYLEKSNPRRQRTEGWLSGAGGGENEK